MPIFRYLKRKWLLYRSFPESWQGILDRSVPYYGQLPEGLKKTLRNHVVIFLDEKLFEGCNGLEMTEEKKVIISAYACILLLGEPAGYYPDLQSILVYPDDYLAPVREEGEGGIVSEGTQARKGESWDLGSIVLSWDDIRENIENQSSGQNLVFHEFAHQLDEYYGLTAGIGEYGEIYRDDEWTHILAAAYRTLQRKSRSRTQCVLDPYGATDPAELFSVATEAFFLKPRKLSGEFPKLYDVLKSFYNLDPGLFVPL
ncbi:zinc-dependent peptidase [Rhodohalobacter sulfatireducens]|uniref:Zinc-dependent peptidase n=1 Tax=Rhodohalobacter sulfatireducens TaxID=2911366 RepID=A0ABS9K969_9BACT|nr:M90 family metallopeptidase [Rhodohalobacter sulfatireducens]MCG2587373.1 zinc-dependent peptidase [Rhodohalobacter sulfatireducens]